MVNKIADKMTHKLTVNLPYGEKTVQRGFAFRKESDNYFYGVVTNRHHITGRVFWHKSHELPVFVSADTKRKFNAVDTPALKPMLQAIRGVIEENVA